jgi:hypothetical protein
MRRTRRPAVKTAAPREQRLKDQLENALYPRAHNPGIFYSCHIVRERNERAVTQILQFL